MARSHAGKDSNMKLNFTASLLIASIAMTGFAAAPAHAGNDDIGKILAGVATLFIISKVLKSNSEKKSNVSRNKSKADSQYKYYDYREPPKSDRKAARWTLPAECRFRVRTEYGKKGVYNARCLNDQFRFARHLPQSCKFTARTHKGHRKVYDAACLHDYGYKVAARW